MKPKQRSIARSKTTSVQEAAPQLWHPEVPGPLWNGTRRVRLDQIKAYSRVLAREFHPLKIILIGSYAYGHPTRHSDVDLVILLSSRRQNGGSTAERIRSRVEAPFPLDLLVWTPQHVAKRLSRDCGFTREVFSHGKTLYEARNR